MKLVKIPPLTASILAIGVISPCAQGGFTFTTLVSFNGTNGANPQAGLVQGQDGNFYGTTSGGGAFNRGTVFRMMPNGSLTNLVSFDNSNGAYPKAGLTQGTNGDFYFYGTTSSGGPSNLGTIFKITTNGSPITLLSFNGTNGANPQAGLIMSSDGNFYGTTQVGGMAGYGTVFKITSNGLLTNLFSFNSTNGAFPLGRLVEGADGKFYGTTFSGGASNLRTFFQITTNGVFTNLVSFVGTNGAGPFSGLLQGTDGKFYGTTEQGYGPGGDTNGYGTIFQITTNGILTTLVSFDGLNGAYPLAGLVRTTDGSFYGTTGNGGTDGYGTIFRSCHRN